MNDGDQFIYFTGHILNINLLAAYVIQNHDFHDPCTRF